MFCYFTITTSKSELGDGPPNHNGSYELFKVLVMTIDALGDF